MKNQNNNPPFVGFSNPYEGNYNSIDYWVSTSGTTTDPHDMITTSNNICFGNTGTASINLNLKQSVFNLPRKDAPIAVYLCGRLLTLGILGTNVECAYTGKKLIFEPGIISTSRINGRVTISVEYCNETYHYNLGNEGQVEYSPNSSILVAELVSIIKKPEK